MDSLVETKHLSSETLAFVGDAVYEVYVRAALAEKGHLPVSRLHKESVRYVRASAQAAAIKALLPALSEEDAAIVRRARNHKPKTMPKNADPALYKWATAFEALIGYYFLSGKKEESDALIKEAMSIIDRGESE